MRSYESVQFPCCIPTEEQTGKFHHQHRWKWLRCVKKAEVSVFISVKEAERRRRREDGDGEAGLNESQQERTSLEESAQEMREAVEC